MNLAADESHSLPGDQPDGVVDPGLPTGITMGGSIVKSLIVGLIVASTLAYTLLSFALSLIGMLGLFFFMLFGLIIGAAMYRAADKTRLISRQQAIFATATVALVCWSIAVVKEAVDYPGDFVEAVIGNDRIHKPRGKLKEVRTELAGFITDYMKAEYPPGGVLGYFKMVTAGRPIELKLSTQTKAVLIEPRVKVWVWWARVLLSVVLLYVAIWSQVSLLTKPPKIRQPARDTAEEGES